MSAMDWFQVGFLIAVVGVGVGGFIWVVVKKD